jgi:hypothetical protein
VTTDTDTYGDLIRHPFPDGSDVFYRDSDHSYWRTVKAKGSAQWSGSGRLTGISTVVAPFDFRPDALLGWAERLTFEGIARGLSGEVIPEDPHELRKALGGLGLRWNQVRDDAGARGTNIHTRMLQALAAGGEVPDLGDLPPEQRGYGQAVMRWWIARDPEPLQVEQCVFADEQGCAGRLDLRYRITDRFGLKGSVGLMDLKTGGFIPTKAHAQVAGYDFASVACGLGEPASEMVILQVHEDGTFDEIPVAAAHGDFLAALDVYRRCARIGKAAGEHRRAVEAVLA